MSDETLRIALESGQWYAAAAAIAVALVRIWRKPAVQKALPYAMQWFRLPMWGRLLIVGGVAFLGSWAASLIAGHGMVAALVAALPVAIAAVSGHKMTKAVGHAMTASELEKDPNYDPSYLRRAVDIVVPIDHHKIFKVDKPK